MNYNVITLRYFDRAAKRLIKKYPSLKVELVELASLLKENPEQGTFIGNNCYKIRLSIASKGKGKSGGARIITYLQILEKTVVLLSVYDKSEQENISDTAIKDLLNLV